MYGVCFHIIEKIEIVLRILLDQLTLIDFNITQTKTKKALFYILHSINFILSSSRKAYMIKWLI